MSIESQQEIINEIYELQNKRKIILNSTKIIFDNDSITTSIMDLYSLRFSNYSILIKENSLAKNFKDSIIQELDLEIGLLIDKLKNI